jgi:hypothetical protein
MKRAIHIILIAAFLSVSVLAFSIHSTRAAYDTGQLIGGIGSDVTQAGYDILSGTTTISDMINKSGLTSKKYTDLCLASNVYSLYKQGIKSIANQVVSSIGSVLQSSLQDMASCAIKSAISGAVSKIPVPGIGKVLGGMSGPQCVQPTKSDTLGYMVQDFKREMQQNFLAQCEVNVGVATMAEMADKMIQEQGAGGEPAYATDWISSMYVKPDQMAYRRFWAELVNTEICSYMKKDILDYFNVPNSYRENPPKISSSQFSVNADDPFIFSAKCTVPDDFSANNVYTMLSLASEPQNNFAGFVRIATAELNRQRQAMTDAAASQLGAGGGFLPTYGDKSKCFVDPDGYCLDPGTIAEPPGAVRDIRNMTLETQSNVLIGNYGTAKALVDMASRIQWRLLNIVNEPLPFKLELGMANNPANFTPEPTPTQSPSAACANLDPRCTCLANDQSAQSLTMVTKIAIKSAMDDNGSLFVSGTNQIAAGVNYRDVLQAICNSFEGGDSSCKPHPTQDNMIVLVSDAASISVDVITSDGFVSTTGGKVIAACELGVQD